MEQESIYLLKVLKSFVLSEAPGAFQGDWGRLIQLAEIHSVTGILGYVVMNYPDASNQQVAPMMRRTCMQTIAVQAVRAESMNRLIEKMTEKGIDHLLIKGFVLKDYYQLTELRTYCDIDFLIRPADRKKSDTLMMQEGFERKTDWEPVYSYVRQMEHYEIHTDLMEIDVSDKADYKGYFRHVWDHAHLIEKNTYELSPEYHFIYLLTHIAKHINSSGAGIRMYLDIAVFIKHFNAKLRWDLIQRELKTLHLTEFSNMVLTVVQEYLGVNSPVLLKKIDPQIQEDFVEFTMAGGVFGHFGRDSGLVALKQQNRNVDKVSRGRTMLRRMFAPAEELEKRYTYLKGRHWLYPVALIHRLLKTRDHWDTHVQEAKSIMNTDVQEVLKLKRIYQEIGL